MADINLTSLHPFLTRNETKVSSGGTVVSYSHDISDSGPVLVLVHGYPQTSFMWRHTVKLFKDKASLFVPELPGYGISSLPPKPDKRTVGSLLVEAAQAVFGTSRPLMWVGHDRGGRVGHRLLVDNDPKHHITSAVLLDIVPTTEQWRAFSNSRAATAYYHWPFLATPMAPQLIELMGGREYILNNFDRVRGKNPRGAARMAENDAVEHYAHYFNTPETIAGSCADYQAGATVDVDEQIKDQEAGRKVKVPTLVIYSASNLGSMHDVPAIWKNWADGEIESLGIGDNMGHFLPEEAPEQTAEAILKWVQRQAGKRDSRQV